MYSRNGRDNREYYREEGMTEEEYEIYRYNIPPRYDGSRFRSRRGEKASDAARDEKFAEKNRYSDRRSYRDTNAIQDSNNSDDLFINEDLDMGARHQIEYESKDLSKDDYDCGIDRQDNEKNTCDNAKPKFPEWFKIGSEEALILTIIFILSADGVKDDIIVLLALLLLAG